MNTENNSQQNIDNKENNNIEKVKIYKSPKEWFKTFFLGIFMGLAIIVPGISGSIIAMIFKLYNKMIEAISSIIKHFKNSFIFLLPLLIGIVTGFILGFFAVQKLLDIAMFECVCLFAGLMIGSLPTLKDEITKNGASTFTFKWSYLLLAIVGLAIPIALSCVSIFCGETVDNNASFDNFPWYLFILMIPIGFVIGISQTMPGISATAFLMTIGMYRKFINSVHLTYWKQNPQIFAIYLILFVFFLVGIFFTSKVLSALISKHKTPTYILLFGFVIGSIVCMFFNSEMNIEYNLLFGENAATSNWQLHISLGIVLLIIGFVFTFLLVLYQRKHTEIEPCQDHLEKTK